MTAADIGTTHVYRVDDRIYTVRVEWIINDDCLMELKTVTTFEELPAPHFEPADWKARPVYDRWRQL